MKYKLGDKVCWMNGSCVERGFVSEIINDWSVYCKTEPDSRFHSFCMNTDLFDEHEIEQKKVQWQENFDNYVAGL